MIGQSNQEAEHLFIEIMFSAENYVKFNLPGGKDLRAQHLQTRCYAGIDEQDGLCQTCNLQLKMKCTLILYITTFLHFDPYKRRIEASHAAYVHEISIRGLESMNKSCFFTGNKQIVQKSRKNALFCQSERCFVFFPVL